MRTIVLAFLLCAAQPAWAQSTSGVVYWPASVLSGYSATLKGRLTAGKTTSASEILSDLGNHKFEILRRDGSGGGELHRSDSVVVAASEPHPG